MSAVTEPVSTPVVVTGFHHYTLLVRDLERAAAFYEGVLGMVRKTRPNFSSRGIWYAIGHQELHLIQTTQVPDCNEGHPALEVNDLRVAVAACVSAGAKLQQDIFLREHDGSYSAFVRDPDDNLLELCQHS